MTKSDIAKELARRHGISYKKALLIVNMTFEILKAKILNGEKVEVRGLGTFKLKRKPGRFVKNPKTGIEIYVKERYVPYYKMSKLLRKKLNGDKEREECLT
ncbi:HU family DNA-binding protein [Aquifex aeolicus]|uniref:Integration host factor beta subunit n=1 Tax=Aquifex aeolicus (strain VF5) TaxID=224324 RepID=O67923_AQUAE|nr:HU family DNA-binding protein [Aquifex aeolicus]AAC07882.1 integration host factor beta subunit [Aquifex aeolicus VF5]